MITTRLLHRQTDGHTDRQRDTDMSLPKFHSGMDDHLHIRTTSCHTDRQTERESDKERETDRQTDRDKYGSRVNISIHNQFQSSNMT